MTCLVLALHPLHGVPVGGVLGRPAADREAAAEDQRAAEVAGASLVAQHAEAGAPELAAAVRPLLVVAAVEHDRRRLV